MRKFATVFSIVMTCAALSVFAQEADKEEVKSSEVSIETTSNDSQETGDVAPQQSEDVASGSDEKPKN